ncbi:MAG: hypothetical protein MUF72_11400 [Elainella sp. Prado103]|nr:hypothetical protein [Elainella sp. Prado103]
MSLEAIKAKLLAVGLFSVSAVGTIALFGAVPVVARMLSDQADPTPHTQVSPAAPVKLSERSPAKWGM